MIPTHFLYLLISPFRKIRAHATGRIRVVLTRCSIGDLLDEDSSAKPFVPYLAIQES
jgi:hypothetical protein